MRRGSALDSRVEWRAERRVCIDRYNVKDRWRGREAQGTLLKAQRVVVVPSSSVRSADAASRQQLLSLLLPYLRARSREKERGVGVCGVLVVCNEYVCGS